MSILIPLLIMTGPDSTLVDSTNTMDESYLNILRARLDPIPPQSQSGNESLSPTYTRSQSEIGDGNEVKTNSDINVLESYKPFESNKDLQLEHSAVHNETDFKVVKKKESVVVSLSQDEMKKQTTRKRSKKRSLPQIQSTDVPVSSQHLNEELKDDLTTSASARELPGTCTCMC